MVEKLKQKQDRPNKTSLDKLTKYFKLRLSRINKIQLSKCLSDEEILKFNVPTYN